MRLQQVLGHLQRHQPLVVRRLRREQLDAGKLLERRLKSAQPLGAREHAAHAFENDDAARAVHLPEESARGRQADAVIVDADEADDLPLLDSVRHVDDGDFCGVEFQHARAHGLEIDGHEHDRVGPPGDHVLDLAHLIGNAVRPRRHVLRDARVHLLRGVLGAHAEHREVRVGLILGEDSDAFVVGVENARENH